MNREEIIALAIECGDDWYSTLPADQEFLIRFARLVAAAEREACAKICDERERANLYGVNECANEIRKR
jgi:hypothetical protein